MTTSYDTLRNLCFLQNVNLSVSGFLQNVNICDHGNYLMLFTIKNCYGTLPYVLFRRVDRLLNVRTVKISMKLRPRYGTYVSKYIRTYEFYFSRLESCLRTYIRKLPIQKVSKCVLPYLRISRNFFITEEEKLTT